MYKSNKIEDKIAFNFYKITFKNTYCIVPIGHSFIGFNTKYQQIEIPTRRNPDNKVKCRGLTRQDFDLFGISTC